MRRRNDSMRFQRKKPNYKSKFSMDTKSHTQTKIRFDIRSKQIEWLFVFVSCLFICVCCWLQFLMIMLMMMMMVVVGIVLCSIPFRFRWLLFFPSELNNLHLGLRLFYKLIALSQKDLFLNRFENTNRWTRMAYTMYVQSGNPLLTTATNEN